ncbi:MAG: hypothetical protein RSO15_14940 [Bacteroides sp.]|uniref:hypothetical protein n=1 Tax=Bacteroides sp. TaxID=29523 RepID=UPI002FCA5571
MSKKLITKKLSGSLCTTRKVAGIQAGETRMTIELPSLEGDTQIYLGQTIVSLIRLNIENDDCYSLDMQHGFKVELMASVLEELNVSIDDIAKVYQERKIVED